VTADVWVHEDSLAGKSGSRFHHQPLRLHSTGPVEVKPWASARSPLYRPMPGHLLHTVKPTSDTDGPTYDYRGAVVFTNRQGTNLTFSLEGFTHGPKGDGAGLGTWPRSGGW
jgi:hypothetical protein